MTSIFNTDLLGILVSLKSYYQLVDILDFASSSQDQFGYSIATSNDGSQLIVGAPTADDSSISDSGKVYIVDRTAESYYGDGTTTVFVTNGTVLGTPVVTVDGSAQTVNDDYSVTGGDTFTFETAPANGSIVKIESNSFVLSQTLDDFESPQTGAQFGYSLDLCPNNCSLYVGAPYEDDTTIDGGKVHRFINQG